MLEEHSLDQNMKQPVIFSRIEPKLTEEMFLLYAAQHYSNHSCVSTEEFLEDLKKIRYLKKLFSIYRKNGELKERLIMNHIIVLFNVFETRALVRMLYFKLGDYWDCLTPFLVVLNRLPEYIEGVEDEPLASAYLPIDTKVADKLRKLLKEGE